VKIKSQCHPDRVASIVEQVLSLICVHAKIISAESMLGHNRIILQELLS